MRSWASAWFCLLTLASSARAAPPQSAVPRAKMDAEYPPWVLAGLGVGVAWPAAATCPYGQNCDLPAGLAFRGWAWAPAVEGFALGGVVDHLRVPWTFERTNTFTFVGAGFSFGSGYTSAAAVSLWMAVGMAYASVGGPCSGDSGMGLELGVRFDYRIARRVRAGVSASQGGGGPGGSCSSPSSASGRAELVPITSETFLSVDVTYEWLRSRG